MAVKPIPDRYHTLTPYIVCDGAAKVLDFVRDAFGATEDGPRMPAPGGLIGHAEFKVGDSIVMIADAATSDQGKTFPAVLLLYVEDVDKTYQRALETGGKSVREPSDQFYGDRTAGVEDPAGNQWWIATHVEDVPMEEMQRRVQELYGKA